MIITQSNSIYKYLRSKVEKGVFLIGLNLRCHRSWYDLSDAFDCFYSLFPISLTANQRLEQINGFWDNHGCVYVKLQLHTVRSLFTNFLILLYCKQFLKSKSITWRFNGSLSNAVGICRGKCLPILNCISQFYEFVDHFQKFIGQFGKNIDHFSGGRQPIRSLSRIIRSLRRFIRSSQRLFRSLPKIIRSSSRIIRSKCQIW